MFGTDDIVTRDGIHLIVSTSGRQPYELKRTLYHLNLSNDEETRISTRLEYESALSDKVEPARVPTDLLGLLGWRGETESFIEGKTYPVFLAKKKGQASGVSFTTRPPRNLSIYVFKDHKVLGKISRIDVSFQSADTTMSVVWAFKQLDDRERETGNFTLGTSVYVEQGEFERLFAHCNVTAERPEIAISFSLICYRLAAEGAFAERWHDHTILIEEWVFVSAQLGAIGVGRNFGSPTNGR